MSTNTIVAKNIGPVERVSIPIPEEGGVTVLLGRNGVGKTKVLEGSQALLKGKGAVERRDRALRGEISGFGATIKVGKSVTRAGQLECKHLEGKLNIADLVEPGIKSPDAADAKRIRALIALTGVQADKGLFYDLVGGQEAFERLVKIGSLETDDLVHLAGNVKRDIEEAARKEESSAKLEEGKAAGCREAIEGIDLDTRCDATELQQALAEAIEHQRSLQQQRKTAFNYSEQAKQAKAHMAAAKADYKGPTLEKATAAEEQAKANLDAARAAEAKAREAFERAGEETRRLIGVHLAKQEFRSLADQHENLLSRWEQAIEQATTYDDPTDEAINESTGKANAAREAVEVGARVRDGRLKAVAADRHTMAAKTHRVLAERLRNAAKGADEVLSGAVRSDVLRVEGGRLVLDTDRGATYFSDLSRGEKWRLAIDIAAERVGEHGLIVIPQEAWEGLDPDNKRAVAEHARERRARILTASCEGGGDLRAEVYEPAEIEEPGTSVPGDARPEADASGSVETDVSGSEGS